MARNPRYAIWPGRSEEIGAMDPEGGNLAEVSTALWAIAERLEALVEEVKGLQKAVVNRP